MPEQLRLDDWHPGNRPARARRRDAASSHDAATAAEKRGTIEAQMRRLLRLVQEHPGRSTGELALLANDDRYALARRAKDLARRGLIERRIRPEKGASIRLWSKGSTIPADAGADVDHKEAST